MSSIVPFVFVLLAIFGRLKADNIASCAKQRPCLVFQESECNFGRRTVCLGVDSSNPDCALGTETVDDMCSIVDGSPQNLIRDVSSRRTCGDFKATVPGASRAIFAVSDVSSSIGTVFGGRVQTTGSTSIRANCLSRPSQMCNTISSMGSALWIFDISVCTGRTCPCDNWGSWSSCDTTCNRNRNCLAPASCTTNDLEHCPSAGCPCSCNASLWSEWSLCSGPCNNRMRTRSRQCAAMIHGVTCGNEVDRADCPDTACPCNCDSWERWSACSVTCGDGTQKRRRTCGPSASCAVSTLPTSQTRDCPGIAETCTTTTTTTTAAPTTEAPTTAAPTTAAPTMAPLTTRARILPTTSSCVCSPWIRVGQCQASCGKGSQLHIRRCSDACGNTQPTSRVEPCDTGRLCPVPTPTPCSCGEFKVGDCSVTCGKGTRLRTRNCSNSCPVTVRRTTQEDCLQSPCPSNQLVGGQSRTRAQARTSPRATRKCRDLPRRQRRACNGKTKKASASTRRSSYG